MRRAFALAAVAGCILAYLAWIPDRLAPESSQLPAGHAVPGLPFRAPAPDPESEPGPIPETGVPAPDAIAVADDPLVEVRARRRALLRAGVDFNDERARQKLVRQLTELEQERKRLVHQRARRLGLPQTTRAGRMLWGFDGEQPIYRVLHNADAAITTATDQVRRTSPFNVDGSGLKIGVWDGGTPYSFHEQLTGRVLNSDGGLVNWHATHVAGTIAGSGHGNAQAIGMAPSATILGYDWDNDLAEMTSRAASGPGQGDKLYVSNHSYGNVNGWDFEIDWYGVFSDDKDPSNDYVPSFGRYHDYSEDWDQLAWNAPYYLIFRSAGNERTEKSPAKDKRWWYWGPGIEYADYKPSHHPTDDWKWMMSNGKSFGTLAYEGVAKNIVTVGAVSDAVAGGTRDLSRAELTDFSSTGPCDDGRIKPDLVANGEDVTSADDLGTDAYYTTSGTSMSTPNASGSALLLVDLYRQLFNGNAMRASTLKGLLLHTADDLGNPGPDYQYGWGLLNTKAAADLITGHAADSSLSRIHEDELNGDVPTRQIGVHYDGNAPIRITLCWTDPAGNGSLNHDLRTPALVHDLDLRLISPSGVVHHPYVMPWVGNWQDDQLDADAIAGDNTVDNVEQIHLPAPTETGVYTIAVSHKGAILAQQRQAFSLLLDGTEIRLADPIVIENPVEDQSFVVPEPRRLAAVATLDDVFAGSGHQYQVLSSDPELVSTTLNPDSTLDLWPQPGRFGTATLTLVATPAFGVGGTSFTIFKVTIIPGPLHVNANSPAPPGSRTGTSWLTAYRSLQDALAAAIEGQEVWVAEGAYYPDDFNGFSSNERDASFTLTPGLRLLGGFEGTETAADQRDPAAHPTILSGDLEQNDIPPNPGEVPDYLDNLRGANSNSVVRAEWAVDAVLDGFTITAGRIQGGLPGQEWRDYGAGLYNRGGPVYVRNCHFTGNYAKEGGGLCNSFDGILHVEDCTFTANSGGDGAAIAEFGDFGRYSRCVIAGNKSSSAAGITIDRAKDTKLTNCLFSGNSGTAITVHQAPAEFVNCTIAANRTRTDWSPGGVYVYQGGLPVFTNCLVWGNRKGPGIHPDYSTDNVDGQPSTFHYSLVEGENRGGTNLDGTNPLLKASFTAPIAADSVPNPGGDFSLQSDSSAIDAGDQTALEYHLPDLTGGERFLDGNGDGQAVIDLGALEFAGWTPTPDSDGDGISDEYELAHSTPPTITGLDPDSDADGDGLTARAEFALGLDPSAPDSAGVQVVDSMELGGERFLLITYQRNPVATSLLDIEVLRLSDVNGSTIEDWIGGETHIVDVTPLGGGLEAVTECSNHPLGSESSEFFRLRITVK